MWNGGDGIDPLHLEPSVIGPTVYRCSLTLGLLGLNDGCTTSRRGIHLLKFSVLNLTAIS